MSSQIRPSANARGQETATASVRRVIAAMRIATRTKEIRDPTPTRKELMAGMLGAPAGHGPAVVATTGVGWG